MCACFQYLVLHHTESIPRASFRCSNPFLNSLIFHMFSHVDISHCLSLSALLLSSAELALQGGRISARNELQALATVEALLLSSLQQVRLSPSPTVLSVSPAPPFSPPLSSVSLSTLYYSPCPLPAIDLVLSTTQTSKKGSSNTGSSATATTSSSSSSSSVGGSLLRDKKRHVARLLVGEHLARADALKRVRRQLAAAQQQLQELQEQV